MRNQIKTGRRQDERGFALLVIFLVAAGVMISLYMEIPRVAFESQRNREEMLIERGEQYSRAIEVFYRKNKRYPQKIEDLESFNNMRFLRKRYVDPLTGKDEWRMVHMGPAGQLADSLVEKPGQMPGQQLAGNGQPGAPGQPTPGQPGVTPAVPGAPPDPSEVDLAKNRIRPSDRNPANHGAAAFDPNNPNAPPQQPPVDANGNPITDPNQLAALNNGNNPGFNPNNPNGQQNPNLPQNGQFPQNGFPQPNFPGQTPNFPGQAPAFPNQPGVNPGGVQPGQNVYYQNGQPFNPGTQVQGQLAAQNGQNPNQVGFGQNPALNAINNQLRNQNNAFGSQTNGQSGFNNTGSGFGTNNGSAFNNPATTSGFNNPTSTSGFGTPVQTSQMSNSTMGGGGIAGVASNQIGVGIKRYNDRKKYKEWEFVFDYRKPKSKPTTGVTGAPPNGLNQSPITPPVPTNTK